MRGMKDILFYKYLDHMKAKQHFGIEIKLKLVKIKFYNIFILQHKEQK